MPPLFSIFPVEMRPWCLREDFSRPLRLNQTAWAMLVPSLKRAVTMDRFFLRVGFLSIATTVAIAEENEPGSREPTGEALALIYRLGRGREGPLRPDPQPEQP